MAAGPRVVCHHLGRPRGWPAQGGGGRGEGKGVGGGGGVSESNGVGF